MIHGLVDYCYDIGISTYINLNNNNNNNDNNNNSNNNNNNNNNNNKENDVFSSLRIIFISSLSVTFFLVLLFCKLTWKWNRLLALCDVMR